MSNAKPMDADHRAMNYITIPLPDDDWKVRPMTPCQRRRWVHKLHRTGEPWPYDGTKGRPTPRQRKQTQHG